MGIEGWESLCIWTVSFIVLSLLVWADPNMFVSWQEPSKVTSSLAPKLR